MKHLFFAIIFLGFTSAFANPVANNLSTDAQFLTIHTPTNPSAEVAEATLDVVDELKVQINRKILKECVIEVKGTIDGVEVDLEITLGDVGWLKCKLIQGQVNDMLD